MTAKIVLCITLFLESVADIKKQQVWLGFPALAVAVGILCSLQQGMGTIKELLISLVITAIFGVISKLSNEAIGMGDVWVMGSILAVMGVMNGMGILFLAFFLAALYGSILLGIKKAGKKKSFPFVPFLFLGTLGGVWMR